MRGEDGGVAALAVSVPGGGGQTAVHCLQMLTVWMCVTKQRERLDASKSKDEGK